MSVLDPAVTSATTWAEAPPRPRPPPPAPSRRPGPRIPIWGEDDGFGGGDGAGGASPPSPVASPPSPSPLASPGAFPRLLQFPGCMLDYAPAARQTCSGLRVQPVVFTCPGGQGVIVFQGCIKNLPELLVSSPCFRGGGDAGLPGFPERARLEADPGALCAEAVMHMYLCSRDAPVVFLSELEGSYAFALFDAGRQVAFAARDGSGRERLLYSLGADGGVAFSSGGGAGGPDGPAAWADFPAGHFMAGRGHALCRHSLSRSELRDRRRSLEDPFDEAPDPDPSPVALGPVVDLGALPVPGHHKSSRHATPAPTPLGATPEAGGGGLPHRVPVSPGYGHGGHFR